ncbi:MULTISPECIES: McrC family protein [Mycobacteriaceae]|uniref:McrC family protein n=1 Tax=Mycobacteriaceae TaxID=1762 RepID=UPI000B2F57CB|nr:MULTISPECIES: McrC family protein [Mycobacteriaceae]
MIALSTAEYRALRALGFVTITPTLEEGQFDVVAARKVGAVSVGDSQIIVRPKIVDLNRLIFLLGYAQNPQVWRDDLVSLDVSDDLMPALAEAFGRIATHAVEQGLLHGYRTVNEMLPVLRGRVLAGEQMCHHYGFPVPIAVQYDDFTVDIAENRILAMATMRLLLVPRISESARRLLQRLRRTFAEVTLPPRGQTAPRWQKSRLNARYDSALRLAEIVLAAESFEHQVGDLSVSGYMFDMWRVFEGFVTAAMSEALSGRGWTCRAQEPMHLDVACSVDMRPDLVCRSDVRTAVIDAKYKAEKPEGFPNADLYQMLAYCTVLGLSDGHLIYAKGNEDGSVHAVQNADITIHCHALDLALTPARLLDQVTGLAGAIDSSSIDGARTNRREIENGWSRNVG